MLGEVSAWATEQLKAVIPMRTRRKLAWRRVALRELTARYRPLPNALIIGAQRCGTSSLYKHLGRHPEVKASIRKETLYFTSYADRGESWYRAHFPLAGVFDRRTRIYFEASPDYMLDPRCAEYARSTLGDALIVALLRDPVSRAYSHYQHNRRLGQEPLGFEEALDAEEDRLCAARERIGRTPWIPLPKEYCRYSYVTRGLYAEQLAPWLEHFSSQNVLVLSSDELFHEPARAFERLTTFLGISPWMPERLRNYSYTGGKRSADGVEVLSPKTRERLQERFSEPNRELERLLGHGFDW